MDAINSSRCRFQRVLNSCSPIDWNSLKIGITIIISIYSFMLFLHYLSGLIKALIQWHIGLLLKKKKWKGLFFRIVFDLNHFTRLSPATSLELLNKMIVTILWGSWKKIRSTRNFSKVLHLNYLMVSNLKPSSVMLFLWKKTAKS